MIILSLGADLARSFPVGLLLKSLGHLDSIDLEWDPLCVINVMNLVIFRDDSV